MQKGGMMLKDYKHFSLDLETLSLRTNAKIMSIGCVEFDIETGNILNSFYTEVNYDYSDFEFCFSEDSDTIEWWNETNRIAFEEYINNKDLVSISVALDALLTFINQIGNNFKIWSVGAKDEMWISNAYESVFDKNPFDKSKGCFLDVRSYEHSLEGIISRGDIPSDPNSVHNALYDATHQAKQISIFYNKLNELKESVLSE